MIILILVVFLVSYSFLIFSYTYQINGLNRMIVNVPVHILETAIPLATDRKETELYFDQEMVKYEYERYLEIEAKRYVEKYEVEYYFYNTKDGGYWDVDNCQGVEICFSAELMLKINYERTMKYEIKEGKIHG